MSLNGKVKAGKSLTGKIENIRQIADLTEMFNKVAPAVASCETATEYAKAWAENAQTASYSASTAAKRADEAADNAEEQTIYDATVSDSGDLLLIRKNGREINAGNVKGEAGKDAEYNLVANALKGNKSGNPIAIPDVSPLPHEIKVKLSGFSVEEVFKYDENSGVEAGFLYTDITESGVYVVKSVTYDEYGDSTYITFEGGVTAEANWLDGDPFAVGDVVFVEVEGETYSFSVLHGATVQKYGINLFDQETFFRNNGFELQADGSWIGKRLFKSAFTPPVQIKGSMYIRLKGKNISAYNPFYLTVNYVEGGQSTACTLPKSMTKMEDFSFATRADKTVKNIYWNYSGTGGSDGLSGEYYIKDVIFSYADAPYEPYTGEQETLTATDGNLSILGNGESMTLIGEEGVTMEAEYNRDINKAFAELQNAIISLGGNV